MTLSNKGNKLCPECFCVQLFLALNSRHEFCAMCQKCHICGKELERVANATRSEEAHFSCFAAEVLSGLQAKG